MPSKAQNIGSKAETIAADYLLGQGYRIVSRNWRCQWGELDLIAQDGELMVFIEVKARRSLEFGSPEESLTRAKQRKLIRAVWQYLQSVDKLNQNWRFDMIAMDLNAAGDATRIDHYKHAIEDLGE